MSMEIELSVSDYHNIMNWYELAFAKKKPNDVYLAQRDEHNDWEKLTYKETLKKVESLSFFLLKQGLSENRPLVILSGNDFNHIVKK